MSLNEITTWQQGQFVDQERYRDWPESRKDHMRRVESYLVRPAPLENAICQTGDPEMAKWIAGRLNLAAKLEQMTYDYATGKTDGSEIVALVREAVA